MALDINWNLALLPHDYVDGFAQSFREGEERGKKRALEDAYRTYAADPEAGVGAVTAVDPISGIALRRDLDERTRTREAEARRRSVLARYNDDPLGARRDALSGGDVDLYKAIDAMDAGQREQTARKLEATGNIAIALMHFSRDPAERLRAAQQALARDPNIGIRAEDLTVENMTDQALQGYAVGTKAYLDYLKGERDLDKPFVASPGAGVFTPRQFAQPPAPPAADRPPGSIAADAPPPPPEPNGPPVQPVQGAPGATMTPSNYTSDDVDALARMILSEAGGEGDQGMAAAGHVALNRLRSGYGGARSLRDVVTAPGQFEGMTSARSRVDPSDPRYQKALQIAQAVIGGQVADPTGGAINFLNPELQSQLGREQPGWAPGNGLRIGNHVFYGGGNPGGNAPGSYEVAANGGTPAPPSGGVRPLATVPPRPSTAAPRDRWVQISPTRQQNQVTGEIKAISGDRRVTAGTLSDLASATEMLQNAASMNTTLARFGKMMDDKSLRLGPIENLGATVENAIGMTDQNARNIASFRASLEKLRNDSLRLNKGVQTEGDSQRAWNELFQSINDPKVVRQRLDEIMELNERAILYRADIIAQTREDAGLPPIDPLAFRKPGGRQKPADAPAGGGKRPALSEIFK